MSGLAKTFDKSKTDITWGITLVLMFRSVGSILFGIAADRYGRKWPFIVNNALFVALELVSLSRHLIPFESPEIRPIAFSAGSCFRVGGTPPPIDLVRRQASSSDMTKRRPDRQRDFGSVPSRLRCISPPLGAPTKDARQLQRRHVRGRAPRPTVDGLATIYAWRCHPAWPKQGCGCGCTGALAVTRLHGLHDADQRLAQ